MIEKFIAAWKARRRWRYRSAITGHFVSKRYAEEYPDKTIRERA